MEEEAKHRSRLESTAYWTAAVRARESAREDHLFKDPWATDLAGPEGLAWIEQRRLDSVLPIVLRTRFFDDFLQRITTVDAVRQVVLMAAGLDTRVFRLPWPDQLRWFELDQAPVLEHKERVLGSALAGPNCQRRTIAADLNSAWEPALIEAGFEPGEPSCWLLEGFLFYLPVQSLTALLERAMRLATPGSWIGFDIINSLTLTSPMTKSWVEMQAQSGAPWIGTMDDPPAFLAARQWNANLTSPGDPDANYGRWPYPAIPTTMPGMPHLWFVTGWKDARQAPERDHSIPLGKSA
jgi:methyltransferase (TIGR00027 family)